MSHNYTVIVAEDEELLLDNLVKKIHAADLGFEVVATAQTGHQAYELVKEYTPDLLITDIQMPVMNGIDLLEKVREKFPLMRFVIVSGFSDFDYARSAIRLQVTEYLLKPIDSEDLHSVLQNIKNKFQAEQSEIENIFNPEMARQSSEQVAAKLKDYLLNNYALDINLNLIANNMHYSPSYLTKIFLQQYDTTPSKFLIAMRMQKAQQLLAHNQDLSIRQVGEAVGYHEQGYFSRVFKKQTGLSPFDYREGHTS
ncbi:MAG: response regulator [Lachnospiraceae bacterium]|nr:response regulator [Lachnospiraceae bacterium]